MTFQARFRLKLLFLTTVVLLGTVFVFQNYLELRSNVATQNNLMTNEETVDLFENFNRSANDKGKWHHFTEEQVKSLSKLGRILYLDEEYPKVAESDKKYKILVWKYGSSIHNRHIKHFTDNEFDPFEKCSVKNCELTYKSEELDNADLVIMHLHRTTGLSDLPPRETRNPKQIWTFLTDESPHHTFTTKAKLSEFNGVFNWSMTYRIDSDIPVAYGRTTLKPVSTSYTRQDFYEWLLHKKSDVLVAMLSSNCGSNNHRREYVKELQKYITVDVYGGCGTLKCPGHFKRDCEPIGDYVFYLSFENSNCNEYITEKLWWNAYSKNSIPIVMGANRENYTALLPPKSYINVDYFASPRALATYINYLYNAHGELQQYMQWRKHYEIKNEHGYFQTESMHYCRVCEALNYNDRSSEKVYEDLEKFWKTDACYARWDA